jgi:hypothetical protein
MAMHILAALLAPLCGLTVGVAAQFNTGNTGGPSLDVLEAIFWHSCLVQELRALPLSPIAIDGL